MIKAIKQTASKCIHDNREGLINLSLSIHSHPELGYKEVHAHSVITTYLSLQGFKVQPSYILPTAFRAVYENGPGPTACIICEYDALPDIGHACGHNLIACAGVAASLGIKEAMIKHDIKGRLIVLGTPAEELDGGKIKMLDKGALEGIDFAMMVHPSPFNAVWSTCLSLQEVKVQYKGKNAHASAAPWEGVNALDALIQAFNGIAFIRQQIKPTWRIHGIITKGGEAPNIIPSLTEGHFYIRAPNDPELDILQQKVTDIFEGAGKSTGCQVNLIWEGSRFSNIFNNDIMCNLYQRNGESLGIKYESREEQLQKGLGSTDMGNVSYCIPSIHPIYHIDAKDANHTPDFTSVCSSNGAHEETLINAQAMAYTTLDIMTDNKVLESVKDFFKSQHPYNINKSNASST